MQTRISSADVVHLRARWIVSMAGPPLRDHYISLAGGRIAAVSSRVEGGEIIDLGDVALLPSLLNAHTHLEFSDLAAPLRQPDSAAETRPAFADWIRAVIQHRRNQREARFDTLVEAPPLAAIRQGQQESLRCGCTFLGEIASDATAAPWVAHVEGVRFFEILGLDPARQNMLLAAARDYLGNPRNPGWYAGLSPHAPYTVGFELLSKLVDVAVKMHAPMAMHLAETPEELELLQSQSGRLLDTLRRLDAWHPTAIPRGITPSDYLRQLARAPRSLVIHGNYLDASDWSLLASQSQMSVVYCPRTYASFHPVGYPLAAMLAAGVRVVVGTDSRASNPDLSVMRELQQVARFHPEIPPETVLSMATSRAADALGVTADRGSIAPGKIAHLAVVVLDTAADDHEALLSLLHSDRQPSSLIQSMEPTANGDRRTETWIDADPAANRELTQKLEVGSKVI
ncbi:MAG: hypothetical protein RIS70_2044 [Planctomycetota bacterium]